MRESLIVVDQLEVKDENEKLLSSGSLEIPSGSTFAIFGPGGSGKSLLLKYIYGLRLENLSYSIESFKSQPGRTFYLDRNEDKVGEASIPNEEFDLYLIDEPENGYTIERFEIFHEKILKEKSTLIFVTHHLGFLEHFAEHVMVLRYGESKGIFTKQDFFNNEDPYIDYLSKMGC